MKKHKFIVIDGQLKTTIKRFPKDRNKALLLSIQKWETIVTALEAGLRITVDGGTTTCGLCQLYVEKNCEGCPVQEHTRQSYCRDTPYFDFSDECEDDNKGSTLETAQRELDFLRSLQTKES